MSRRRQLAVIVIYETETEQQPPQDERSRLITALRLVGGLELLAQCPVCLAERTNGERHDDNCALVASARKERS